MTDPLSQRVDAAFQAWCDGEYDEAQFISELHTLIRDLEADRQQQIANLNETHAAWNRENELRHEVEADRRRLRAYVEHRWACAVHLKHENRYPCSCGLDADLAEVPPDAP